MRQEHSIMYYMGIDVGTSGCKAAIIDCHGVVCAKSSRTYTLLSPQVGWLELNPATLLEQVKQCILELYPFTKDVTGIATCSIGESMVILDEHDAPVTNCISYLDRRLTATEDAFTRSIAPDQLYDVTYLPVSEMYSARQLLWYQQNQPEVLARAKQILPVCNYIDYVLTGEAAIDYTQASRTMLFDARTHSWSEEFARILGINLRLFPKPSRCGTLVGKIRPKVAAELGLNPNASVYLGGHDQPISTLGSGVFKRGEIMMGQGSTESMNYLLTPSSNDLELFKKDRVCLEPFIDEELFIVTLGQLCYGTSIRWFARANRICCNVPRQRASTSTPDWTSSAHRKPTSFSCHICPRSTSRSPRPSVPLSASTPRTAVPSFTALFWRASVWKAAGSSKSSTTETAALIPLSPTAVVQNLTS